MGTLKTDKIKIEERFDEALKSGKLKGVETNSNWVEFWYWMTYNNVKILVNGEEFGLDRVGKLSKILTNGETVRTVWSKKRSALKLRLDTKSQQEFKEVMGKND